MCRVHQFCIKTYPVGNVPPERFQNQGTASGTQGGAVLFAPPSKSCRFSHPPSTCAQKHGHGDFAVCGQRLRGHVPSKNTSPTVLSWIRLTTPTTPVLSVPARYFPLSPHKKCTPDFSDVHMISKVILRACVRRKYMRIFEQIFLQTRQKFAGILSYGKNFSRSMQQNFPKRRR